MLYFPQNQQLLKLLTFTGIPRLPRMKKDTNNTGAKPNRFGFRTPTTLSNKVADTQNNISSTKANLRVSTTVIYYTKSQQKLVQIFLSYYCINNAVN